MSQSTNCPRCNWPEPDSRNAKAARARWQRKTAKQRSEAMKAVRAKGLKK